MKIAILLSILGAALAIPTGLVGPSGVIGPSGLVGPSGPVQFSQPAWAFLGNAAHAHIAHLNAHRAATNRALAAHKAAEDRVKAAQNANIFSRGGGRFEAAPANLIPGIDSKGCLVAQSGKICPTGNVQFVV